MAIIKMRVESTLRIGRDKRAMRAMFPTSKRKGDNRCEGTVLPSSRKGMEGEWDFFTQQGEGDDSIAYICTYIAGRRCGGMRAESL
jgi:hypothetical protein